MFMNQEKLKKLLSKCINTTEQKDAFSLAELVTEMKIGLKENGFSDNSSKETV